MATALVPASCLQTREARKKLAIQDAPYYHGMGRGLALGYRRGIEGSSWLLREFRGGKYVKQRLGATDDKVQSDGIDILSWDEATQIARGSERPTVTKPGKYTLAQAAEVYFDTRSATTPHESVTTSRLSRPSVGRAAIAAPPAAQSVNVKNNNAVWVCVESPPMLRLSRT